MNGGDGGEPVAKEPGPQGRPGTHLAWDDLVLPEHQRKVLNDALAELARRRSPIADAREPATRARPGITLVFAGGIGTGKTMAAQLLAGELRVGVVELDLLSVAAQDNAEAEKAVDRALADAERSNAILVFDRAESLLAPRSGSRHSRGRAASTEIRSLIERSHTHSGVVIFASRLSPKLDPSLQEGTDFAVEFPFPASAARKEIWRKLLPRDARVSDDQLENLASTFKLPGAAIWRCCVRARDDASTHGTPVELVHLARALHQEYRGRLVSEETGEALRRLVGPETSPKASSATSPSKLASDRPKLRDPPAPVPPVRFLAQKRRSPTRFSRTSVVLAVAGILIAAAAGFAIARSMGGNSARPRPVLRVTSAAGLPPGQSANYASALNAAIHKLNLVRSSAGLQLSGARSEAAQVQSANQLAAAHAAAASDLGALNAGTANATNAAVVAALRAIARAYLSLAGAAAANQPRAYNSASGSVSRANRQLGEALRRLSSLGYRIG